MKRCPICKKKAAAWGGSCVRCRRQGQRSTWKRRLAAGNGSALARLRLSISLALADAERAGVPRLAALCEARAATNPETFLDWGDHQDDPTLTLRDVSTWRNLERGKR